MARNCPHCGRYLGASLQCTRCTSASSPNPFPARPRRSVLPPSSPPSPATDPSISSLGHSGIPNRPHRAATSPPSTPSGNLGRSGFLSLRGTVVKCSQGAVPGAQGVAPVRIILCLATAVLLLVNGQDLVIQGILGLFIQLLPYLLLVMLASWLLTKLHLKGCAKVLKRLPSFILRTVTRLGTNITKTMAKRSRPGWQLVIEHAGGQEQVRIAANAPFMEGQTIQVHGPRVQSVRDTWLVQGIAPVTFTRLGRGLVSTLILTVVLVPVCVWLLTR